MKSKVQVLTASGLIAVTLAGNSVDYSCLHAQSWTVNNDHYNSYFSSVTGVQSSYYFNNTQSRRRLTDKGAHRFLAGPPTPVGGGGGGGGGGPGGGSPPPMGGGGGGGSQPMAGGASPPPMNGGGGGGGGTPDYSPDLTEGWQINFSGIPNYDHVITADEISTLNSRPKASTDFKSGSATTAVAGNTVVFGEDINYSSTGCTDGYWPPGPVCPEAYDGSQIFSVNPSPEMASGGCYAGNEYGYFVNGIPFWSWSDTASYNNAGVWHNLAGSLEQYDMDICGGHSAQGVYHHHFYSPCLGLELGDDGTAHSPLHGFAYDSYPVYGPYQAADTLAVSCWQARDYSASSLTGCSGGARTCTLVDEYDYTQGTTTASSSGPSLTGTVTSLSGNSISAASGIYYEDFFFNSTCYAAGGEYLDSHNGHSHGSYGYHYHMTITSAGVPTFPYILGPKFYGCVEGNTCSSSYSGSSSSGQSICGAKDGIDPSQSTCKVSPSSPTSSPASTPTGSRSPTRKPTATPSGRAPTRVPSGRVPTVKPTTGRPTVRPSSAVPTISRIPTARPTTAVPSVSFAPSSASIDYGCLHADAWLVNHNGKYSTIYESEVEVQSSYLINGTSSSRRRLVGTPSGPPTTGGGGGGGSPPPMNGGGTGGSQPPMSGGGTGGSQPPMSGGGGSQPTGGGGGSTPTTTSTTLTVGWQVKFTGIPDYGHNITSAEISTLNGRPKASTDFVSNSATTATVGEFVAFGQNIGYATSGCEDGYWPPGPGCPAAYDGSEVFPLQPAPEMTEGGCYTGNFIGYLVNGVPFWNWADTNSYNSAGVWNNLAGKFEQTYDMDICGGHSAQGVYHHHAYSPCLADRLNDEGDSHSPVYGFAYDGYPIYGPYQAADTLAVSCWQTRDYATTSLTGCSDGTRSCQLVDQYDWSQGTTSVTAGPSLTSTVETLSGNTISSASGIYFEDMFFNFTCAAWGGRYLDSFNGHDHDNLGYHYHFTVDSDMVPQFPYSAGPKFYGCVPGNTCSSTYASTVGGGGGGGGGGGPPSRRLTASQCGVSSARSTTSCPVSATSPTLSPTVSFSPSRSPSEAPVASHSPSATPVSVPTVTFEPTAAPIRVDYEQIHEDAWVIPEVPHFNNIFNSDTGLKSAGYVDNSRRLSESSGSNGLRGKRMLGASPTPARRLPGDNGGGATFEPTNSVGWQIEFTGIPDYDHDFTAAEVDTMNSRPNAATDFVSNSATTVSAGDFVVFGQDIGYVHDSCEDGYWPPGPGCPEAYNGSYIFSITPAPEVSDGGCYTGGRLGYFVNGVPFWSWTDGRSYQDQTVWNDLAGAFEARYDMDVCMGHAAEGVYHHHTYSPCLATALGDEGDGHSPVYGFAYDSYPVYGPYQSAGTLAVSCWQARDYSASSPTGCSNGDRSCQLVDPYDYTQGTTDVTDGPSIYSTLPEHNPLDAVSGIYFEDYFFNSECAAQGEQYLDEHNGHKHGTIGYHYHLTVDSDMVPAFPYTVGPKFYGCQSEATCYSSYKIQYGTTTSQCGTSDSLAAAPTAAPSSSPDDSKAPLSTGAIIGIAVGGFVGLVAVCYFIFLSMCSQSAVSATGVASAPQLEVAMAGVSAQPIVPTGKEEAL